MERLCFLSVTLHQNRCQLQHSHITLVPVAPAKQKRERKRTDRQTDRSPEGYKVSLIPTRVVPVADAAAQTQHPSPPPSPWTAPDLPGPQGQPAPREGPTLGSAIASLPFLGLTAGRPPSSLSRELWATGKARPSAGWACPGLCSGISYRSCVGAAALQAHKQARGSALLRPWGRGSLGSS